MADVAGSASKLAGGWRLNGLIAAYSGQPFTVTSSNPLNAPNNSQRANLAETVHSDSGGHGSEPILLRSVRICAGQHGDHRNGGSRRGARSRHVQFRCGLVARVRFYGTLEDAVPGRGTERDQHAPFREPGRQRVEHGVELRRLNPEPGWIHGHHQHDGTGREGIDERMFRLGLRIIF